MAEKEVPLSMEPARSLELLSPAHEDQPIDEGNSEDIATNYLKRWPLHVVTIA